MTELQIYSHSLRVVPSQLEDEIKSVLDAFQSNGRSSSLSISLRNNGDFLDQIHRDLFRRRGLILEEPRLRHLCQILPKCSHCLHTESYLRENSSDSVHIFEGFVFAAGRWCVGCSYQSNSISLHVTVG